MARQCPGAPHPHSYSTQHDAVWGSRSCADFLLCIVLMPSSPPPPRQTRGTTNVKANDDMTRPQAAPRPSLVRRSGERKEKDDEEGEALQWSMVFETCFNFKFNYNYK
eukprot:scaffold32685_cov33-Tisochrysis_lutea.AAC.3